VKRKEYMVLPTYNIGMLVMSIDISIYIFDILKHAKTQVMRKRIKVD